MNKIIFLKEKLEQITGRKVIFVEFVDNVYSIIKNTTKVKQGISHVKNEDFDIIFDIEGDTLTLTWINVKSGKFTGKDVLSALIQLAHENGANKIRATGVRGKYHGKLAYGYYALLKWGFIPDGGIAFLNKVLGTKYGSIKEAFADPQFWAMWKDMGVEFTGTLQV
jgi:hypothetical protein